MKAAVPERKNSKVSRWVTCEGILLDGHKGMAVEVPFDPAEAWGTKPRSVAPGRKGHPVDATLNGKAFRTVKAQREWRRTRPPA